MTTSSDSVSDGSKGVRVKPLEWRVPTDRPDEMEESAILIADGLGGHYAISHPQKVGPKFLLWWAHDPFDWAGFDTPEEAKAAAQADYEQRIWSALDSGTGGQQPVVWWCEHGDGSIEVVMWPDARDKYAARG